MLLLDAGVWVALGEPGDRHHSPAEALVRDFSIPLAALDLTFYEVANVVGRKKGRYDEAKYIAQLVLARCSDRVARVDADLLDLSLRIAAEHGLTAYDAAYVAAARLNGWTLVSTDVADLVSKGLAVTPDAADYP
ncbi:MAG: PIN domain-containing protein [Chloroflexota bacterium]